MFFNKRLQKELLALREEVAVMNQIRDSLNEEMLLVSLDSQARFSSVNANFEQELGCQERDLLGKPLFDLVPSHFKDTDHFSRLREAINQGQHWCGALQVNRGGQVQKVAWLRAILQPIRSTSGRLLQFSLTATNLTRTIEKSREHENIISAMQRSTAVIEFDLGGHVLAANDRFLDSMGYSLPQIQGKHHRMFCTPEEYNSDSYHAFWEKLRQGQFVADRFQRIDSRNKTVWLEASYNPIYDAYGKLYKVVKFATVITDEVKREQVIASAAEIAYTTSLSTDNSAQKGNSVVQDTVKVMRDLADQMDLATESIAALDRQSQEIGSIIKSISSIADQTNLLALNAAIEAARAGDQGRGFAVVADEVRQLASRTSVATEEIITVVSQNQALAAKAVAIIENGKQQAQQGLSLVSEAGVVIVEIQDGAQRVVDAIGQVTNQLAT